MLNKAVLELGRVAGGPWPEASPEITTGNQYGIDRPLMQWLDFEVNLPRRSLFVVDLNGEKCVACRRDSPPVTQDEMETLHELVSDWALVTEDGIKKLDRGFKFPDFQQSLDFTVLLGALAEEEGHHPRLVTEWGSVKVTCGPTRYGTCTATTLLWLPSRMLCTPNPMPSRPRKTG